MMILPIRICAALIFLTCLMSDARALILQELWAQTSVVDTQASAGELTLEKKVKLLPIKDKPDIYAENLYDKVRKSLPPLSPKADKIMKDNYARQLLDLKQQITEEVIHGSEKNEVAYIKFNATKLVYEPGEEMIDNGEMNYYYNGVNIISYSPLHKTIDIKRREDLTSTPLYEVWNLVLNFGRKRSAIFKDPSEVKITEKDDSWFLKKTVRNEIMEYEVDKINLLTKKIIQYVNGKVTYSVIFENFETINGQIVPLKITKHFQDDPQEILITYTIKGLKLNPTFDFETEPSNFGLCTVQDSRTEETFIYPAKGRLPSEETLLTLMADKKKFDDYKLMIQKRQ